MNRLSLIAGLSALLLGGLLSTTSEASTLKQIQQNTFTITLDDGDNEAICTGEAISKNTILVAQHCLEDPDLGMNFTSILTKISGRPYALSVVKSDRDNDVAILRITSNALPFTPIDIAPLPVYNVKANFGDPVYVVANPLDDGLVVTQGFFGDLQASPLPKERSGFFYHATAPIAAGSSGGGLYIKNGDDYELVGIASVEDRRDGNSFEGYFATAESIHELIDQPDTPVKK